MLWSAHHENFQACQLSHEGDFTTLQMRKSSQKGDLPQGQGANKQQSQFVFSELCTPCLLE